MASVCSLQTSYAHTSASPAFARCAANRLPTAPQPTIQIFIWGLFVSDSLLTARCFRCFLPGKKLPRNLGEALPFGLAHSIGVLCIQADLSVTIDHLGMEREDHVLFQRDFAPGTNRRVLKHGRTDGMSR